MKKIIFFATLLPFLSFGQKYEISDLAGYGGLIGPISNAYQYGTIKSGFSNLLSFDYKLNRTFSVGATYLLNSWNATGNSFGVAANCHYYNVYCGIDISDMMFHSIPGSEKNTPEITYKPTLSTGVHIGGENKIYKCLYSKEQIGVNYSSLTFSYNTQFANGAYMPAQYHENCTLIYILLGLACRL